MSAVYGTATVPQVIEYLFNAQLSKFQSEEINAIEIEAGWKDIIGQQGIASMVSKLEEQLKAPISVTYPSDKIRLQITESKAISNERPDKDNHTSAKEKKVPRPPNAFIIYRQTCHGRMKAAYPNARNVELSKIIGKAWKEESAAARQYFNDLATKFKNEHAKLFPNYTYQPRKSVDKKRRMTPRKKAQANALAQALQAPTSSATAGFSPLSSQLKPTLLKMPFGNHHTMINFTLGDENVTSINAEAMIAANNEQVNAITHGTRLQSIAPIITASPAAILDADMEAFDNFPGWGEFDSARCIDGDILDAMYQDHWEDPTDPWSPLKMAPRAVFGGNVEVSRQANLLGIPSPAKHNNMQF